ncbi:serine palmitoyltransferase 2, partial [Elysia marginata]
HSQWQDDFHESFEETPLLVAILTYLGYALLVVIGQIRDLMRAYGIEKDKSCTEPKLEGFVPLFLSWESFYTRNLYRRVRDCWNRPVASCAGVRLDVMERTSPDFGWNFQLTGKKLDVMNFGSYNYLGFAESSGPCANAVHDVVQKYGVGVCASRQEMGYMDIHKELDELVAEYLGVEAAMTVPMGFATNSLNMPALVSKGSLILSDELNHASLILGSRLTGAVIRTFKHNVVVGLVVIAVAERVVVVVVVAVGVVVAIAVVVKIVVYNSSVRGGNSSSNGSGRTSSKVILVVVAVAVVVVEVVVAVPLVVLLVLVVVVVEMSAVVWAKQTENRATLDIPSRGSGRFCAIQISGLKMVWIMEGSIVRLPEVVRLKQKYKAYIYLDEAHSVGAMGPHGRGVVDYFGLDPKSIDIMMGTFTKSFGSAGGYIGGSKRLINHLKVHAHSFIYSTAMSPPVAQQVISSMRIIMGKDGTQEGLLTMFPWEICA